MKKRIAFLIALLMILCLALAGCAQRDNHAGTPSNEPVSESHDGGIGNPDSSESNTDVEPTGEDTNPDETYVYNVQGTEFVCKHNIDDYISEKDGYLVFNLIMLAKDNGWKFIGASDTALRKQIAFTPVDDYSIDSPRVQIEDKSSEHYDTIFFNFSTDSSGYHSDKVIFVRSDLMSRDGETHQTYYVNSYLNGKTINRDMAIVLCYLIENISADGNSNPFQEIFHTTGPYNL